MKDAIQADCTHYAPGIEIISVRVTKPNIPKSVKRNFEQIEEERTKVLYFCLIFFLNYCMYLYIYILYVQNFHLSADEYWLPFVRISCWLFDIFKNFLVCLLSSFFFLSFPPPLPFFSL